MNSEFDIRDISTSSTTQLNRVATFLDEHSLKMEPLDYIAGVFDSDDRLVGCGGFSGNTIKCIALDKSLRNCNLSGKLISHLRSKLAESGIEDVTIFSKPENIALFRNLGFIEIATTDKATFMESNVFSLKDFLYRLNQHRCEGAGAIVMNANPFTLGHLHLIRQAASQVSHLFILPLEEESHTTYKYSDRLEMIRKGIEKIKNVSIVECGHYTISASTFPSYFLKNISDATEAHISLDLEIFARHIAPALGVTHRFIGTEPNDKLTALYNKQMKELLPTRGIEVTEIERLHIGNNIISASTVRELIESGYCKSAFKLVPKSSLPWILAHAATQALQEELDLTPKPGLVDCNDCGAHSDMDYNTMSISIKALYDEFRHIAEISLNNAYPSVEVLIKAGIAAEKKMLDATGGINTYKGAIFAIGLAISAVAHLLQHSNTVSRIEVSNLIASTSQLIPDSSGTHGAITRKKYGIPGAIEMARSGYSEVFSKWLPLYESFPLTDTWRRHRILLNIISDLKDSNIYYRAGEDGMKKASSLAQATLSNISEETLRHLNDEYVAANLSPGGAADMLSLTFFLSSVTTI